MRTGSTAPGSRAERSFRFVMVASAYLALTVIFTWPGVRHLDTMVFGGSVDGLESVWVMWWMRFSLVDLAQSPLFCQYLFYPDGVNMVFQSIPKFTDALSLPLQELFSLTVAYNLVWLSTFWATGMTAFWLAHRVIGERLPAFFAGAFFTFSTYHFGQQSHMNLLPTMLIPVYAALVIMGGEALRGPESGRRRGWWLFAAAGVSLGLIAYDTEHYAIYLLLFSGVYLGFHHRMFRDPARRPAWLRLAKGVALSGLVGALVFSPILLSAARAMGGGDYVDSPIKQQIQQSADILAPVVPDLQSFYFGSAFSSISRTFEGEPAYIGWLVLLLAAAGFWRYRRSEQARLWLAVAAVFTLLALGPFVRFMGELTYIPGPYLLLYKIPLLGSTRSISRFIVMSTLAFSILAGFGVSTLMRRLKDVRRPALAGGTATIILFGVFFVEARPILFMTESRTPPVYERIAASDNAGSVIEIPLGWESGLTEKVGHPEIFPELYQSEHGRPLVSGIVARAPAELVTKGATTPVLGYLASPERGPSEADLDPAEIDRVLRDYEIAFIVIHKKYPATITSIKRDPYAYPIAWLDPEILKRLDQYITGPLGMERFEEDESVIAYRTQPFLVMPVRAR